MVGEGLLGRLAQARRRRLEGQDVSRVPSATRKSLSLEIEGVGREMEKYRKASQLGVE